MFMIAKLLVIYIVCHQAIWNSADIVVKQRSRVRSQRTVTVGVRKKANPDNPYLVKLLYIVISVTRQRNLATLAKF